MTYIPKPHDIYKHFKGNLYQIVTLAEHTETGETLVIYQALYGNFKRYARPLDMFTSKVDTVKYPQATQEYRFELQGQDSQGQISQEQISQEQPQKEVFSDTKDTVKDTKDTVKASENDATEANNLEPMVIEFLDTSSYAERLNILAGLHHRITDEMISTMAIACDVEVPAGDLEERYEGLKTCLLTLEKYECNRIR